MGQEPVHDEQAHPVADPPELRLEPVPAHVDARWRSMVKGVHRLEKELLAVLDVSAVIGTAGQTNKAA